MSSDLERLLLGFSRHAQKSMGNLNNIQEQQIAFFQPPPNVVNIASNICINFFQDIKKLKDNDFLKMERNVKYPLRLNHFLSLAIFHNRYFDGLI